MKLNIIVLSITVYIVVVGLGVVDTLGQQAGLLFLFGFMSGLIAGVAIAKMSGNRIGDTL